VGFEIHPDDAERVVARGGNGARDVGAVFARISDIGVVVGEVVAMDIVDAVVGIVIEIVACRFSGI
jgi:hypothetical protein